MSEDHNSNGRYADTTHPEITAPLQIKRAVELASPAMPVFYYVTDHSRICELVPRVLSVVVDNTQAVTAGGPGCVRYCDFGNDIVTAETIFLWNPPEAFGYRISSPNPFGLHNHSGFITLDPGAGHTRLTLSQYYDHADLPSMNALMAEMLDGAVRNLINRFGGRQSGRIVGAD